MAAQRAKVFIARDFEGRGPEQAAHGRAPHERAPHERAGPYRAAPERTAPDIFDSYPPPFDLRSDMLFVGAMAPTHPLRRVFPETPFLGVAGYTPLIIWFSRVRSLCYRAGGAQECLDESTGFGYAELNVVAALRGRRMFGPGIYATGQLSPRLGRRYGMPKERVDMSFAADIGSVRSSLQLGGMTSEVSASILSSGRLFAIPFRRAVPWWTWPVSFPDGSFISARILSVPRVKLAHVEGRLGLPVPWLPGPLRLLPVGAYVPGLRMLLPGPGGREAGDVAGSRGD